MIEAREEIGDFYKDDSSHVRQKIIKKYDANEDDRIVEQSNEHTHMSMNMTAKL